MWWWLKFIVFAAIPRRTDNRNLNVEMWSTFEMLTLSRPVMMTHLWEFDEQLRHWDTPILWQSSDLRRHIIPGLAIVTGDQPLMMVTVKTFTADAMCHYGLRRKSHEKYTRNLNCEIEGRSWNVLRFLNYHNVKSETNQPICKSYKRIFYGRRFHPYILNTWYLNHLICISKKHCGYFDQLSRNVEILPTSIILPLLSISRYLTWFLKAVPLFKGLVFAQFA